MTSPFAPYNVLDKWRSPSFDAVTRGVLNRRMHAVPGRRFFAAAEFALLEAICARLIAQADQTAPVPIAPWIDADLHEGRGSGFRHPNMPPASQAWRQGLAGIDAEARARFGVSFTGLPGDSQDSILTIVQKGESAEANFPTVPAAAFFSDMLLNAVVGVYYAHPAAWSEVGFGGPASPRGYVRIGLDRRDPWEAPGTRPPGEAP